MKYIFAGNVLVVLAMIAAVIIDTPAAALASIGIALLYPWVVIPVVLWNLRGKPPIDMELARAIRY